MVNFTGQETERKHSSMQDLSHMNTRSIRDLRQASPVRQIMQPLWTEETRPTLGRAFPVGNPIYTGAACAAIEASKTVGEARTELVEDTEYCLETAKLELETEKEDFDDEW